jgi:hypothetical protein
MDQKERSDRILEWIKAHPILKHVPYDRWDDVFDMNHNTYFRATKSEPLPKKHLDIIENTLLRYGFEPIVKKIVK